MLLYATDDDHAGEEIERWILTAGSEPVKVGRVEQSGDSRWEPTFTIS